MKNETKMASTIAGGCLCGAIRYEAIRSPFRAGYCHCRQCQRALGNLFGPSIMFRLEDIHFLKGNLKWWHGRLADRGFCGDCGAPIAFQYRGAGHITIWVGSLDEPEAFRPEAHWGVESRLPWVDIHKDLPSYRTDEYLGFQEANARVAEPDNWVPARGGSPE
jgi:adenylate cyclase